MHQDRVSRLEQCREVVREPPERGIVVGHTEIRNWNDRTSHGDYSLSGPGALEKAAKFRYANFEAPPPAADQWLVSAERYAAAARKIQSHGGEVVFVRLPSSGKLAELFERDYPKARYWDAFAKLATTIHYRDVPAMAGMQCPDEMHLDQRDQPAWTKALVDEIRARGLMRN